MQIAYGRCTKYPRTLRRRGNSLLLEPLPESVTDEIGWPVPGRLVAGLDLDLMFKNLLAVFLQAVLPVCRPRYSPICVANLNGYTFRSMG